MPVVGPIENKLFPGPADGPNGGMWTSGYRSRFRKETEHASPGYYGVDLLDYHVKAELTSTMRCGLMQLTFPESDQSRLLLDFGFPTEERTQILGVTARQTSPTEIEGSIKQKTNTRSNSRCISSSS
jgi:putative alpha-1,2-mannosidase